jgi:hypothetical protein
MGRFGKKLAGALKKIMGLSLSHSNGSSSTRYIEHEESLMHEDEEIVPFEEQEDEEQPMEEDHDAPTSTWKESGRCKHTTSSRTMSYSTRRCTTPHFSKP